MAKKLASNMKKRLSQCKQKCPGLNEEVYILAEYISKVISDECDPLDLLVCLALSLADVRRGRSGFVNYGYQILPEQIEVRKAQIIAQAVFFPQIVDAILDENFATEFRVLCKKKLGFDPPKREKTYNQHEEIGGNYPEYVVVAVNWWTNAIRHPKFDTGSNEVNEIRTQMITKMVNAKSKITKEQIKNFKSILAKMILQKMKDSGHNELIISVDYAPDQILYLSARKAGIKETESFPWKTNMLITPDKVCVSSGEYATSITIWSK